MPAAAKTTTPMPSFLLARQPILDRNLRLFGYELLYRVGDGEPFDADQATSRVLLEGVLHAGRDALVHHGMIFVNLTRNLLLQPELLPRGDGRVVLEVLEDVEVDDRLLEALQELKRRGYRIALDDFVWVEERLELLEVADLVKVELRAGPLPLEEVVRRLSARRLMLLAEKVETFSELEECKALGFQLFQGYFLERPRVVTGGRQPASRLSVMRLLAALQDPEADVEKQVAVIRQDINLSYRLLRYINSAQFAFNREIRSLHEAAVILGRRNLRNWAMLLALASIEGKPDVLITSALIRARTVEGVVTLLGGDRAEAEMGFLAGLFSLLDAFLDRPMEKLLEELPVDRAIAVALLHGEGSIGAALEMVRIHERAAWEEVDTCELDPGEVSRLYLEAAAWADAIQKEIA